MRSSSVPGCGCIALAMRRRREVRFLSFWAVGCGVASVSDKIVRSVPSQAGAEGA